MSILTDAQLAILETELGDIDDALADDVQERYDRLGSINAVALEVLRGRLSRLLSKPASFTLTGVMSKDTSANIRALQPQIDRLQSLVTEETAAAAAPSEPVDAGRLVRTDRGR